MDDSVYDTNAQKMSEMVILNYQNLGNFPPVFLSFVFQSKSTENYKLTDKQKAKKCGKFKLPKF